MTASVPKMRRIAVFDVDGRSRAILDDIPVAGVIDPARPGFQATTYWVSSEAPVVISTPGDVDCPETLEPPPDGSLCRVVTFPPESAFVDDVTADDVADYFASVGAEHCSTYSPGSGHPYMHKTETLDFCMVISGEITLVLDNEEVDLEAGDTVVQRGTNHAWSNRSDSACVVVIASHDARGSAV